MDCVLTSYFTGKPDPQSGKFRPENNADLMRPWCKTLTGLGLHGVICYDNPLLVVGKNIDLHHYTLKTDWSVNDERFLCWLEVLAQHSEIKRVFLTDLFDVDFFKNPFDLITDEFDLYAGCGAGLNRPIGLNKWLCRKMDLAYGKIYHGKQRTINAGVIGGKRENIMLLLNHMVSDFNLLKNTGNINMAVFNKNAYDLFDRILIGPPLTSQFKKYEQTGNFAIRHK